MISTCLLPDAQATCRELKNSLHVEATFAMSAAKCSTRKRPEMPSQTVGTSESKMQLSRQNYKNLVKQVFDSGVVD